MIVQLTADEIREIDRETLERTRDEAKRDVLYPYPAERPLMVAIGRALKVDPAHVRIVGQWAFGSSVKPTGRYWLSLVTVDWRDWYLPTEVQYWIDRRNACPRDRMPVEPIRFTLRKVPQKSA